MEVDFKEFTEKMRENNGVYGIISEFNPFHKGHAYLLEQVRAQGAEGIVCAMSGNFVQRGEAAMFSKWTRASCAVEAGADLVLELPVSFAVAGAERFAKGGVALLAQAGCKTLAFGSEEGELAPLLKAAELMDSPLLKDPLKKALREGKTFAAARAEAMEEVGDEKLAQLLQQPNSTLGIEYIKAAKEIAPQMDFFTVKRAGAQHDAKEITGYSASVIRASLAEGKSVSGLLPLQIEKLIDRELSSGAAPAENRYLERAILAFLRQMKEEEYALLPDISEGIENRLYKAVHKATSLEELYDEVKVKRYTHARIRRLVMNAFLGIREPLPKEPLYLKVLAANQKGLSLLKEAKLPVITKYSQVRFLSAEAKALYEQECRADDLFALAQPRISPCGGNQRRNFMTDEKK